MPTGREESVYTSASEEMRDAGMSGVGLPLIGAAVKNNYLLFN